MESRIVHPLIKELNAICRGERIATPDEIKNVIASIQTISEYREKEIAECKDLLAKHPNLKIAIPEKMSIDSADELGETPLMVAAANNNKMVVQALLDAKADVNAQDKNGLTALMHATDHPEMVDVLIGLGANPNIQNNKGQTALVAALNSLIRFEKTIIKLTEVTDPATLNARDSLGRTALMLAIENRQWDVAKHLIRAKADVNIKGLGGATALTLAIESGQLDIVEMLLREKAEVNVQEASGKTPLMLAVPFPLILNKILDEKPELNAQDKEGNTALMYAVSTSPESVKRLISAKPDVELQNKDGFSALMLAAKHGKLEEGVALLDAGALVHTNTNQPSPLMLSVSQGKYYFQFHYANPLIKRLIEETKDINDLNETDSNGNTLLLLALKNHNLVTAVQLIKAKADANKKNKAGETAFQLAVRSVYVDVMDELIKAKVKLDEMLDGNTALTILIRRLNDYYSNDDYFIKTVLTLIKELILAKVDLNKPTFLGDTPLTLAVTNGRSDVAHQLLNAGADPNMPDHNGNTPLILAVEKRARRMAYDILNQGNADTERVNRAGETALDRALSIVLQKGNYSYGSDYIDHKENIAMVSLLLSKGAKVTKKNIAGWPQVFRYYYDSRDPAVLTIIRELCKQVKNSPLVNEHPYKEPYRAALTYLIKLDELTEIHRNKAAHEVEKALGNTIFEGVKAMCPPGDTRLQKEEKGEVEVQKIVSLIAKYDAPLEEPRLRFFLPDKLGEELNKARASIGQKSCTIL